MQKDDRITEAGTAADSEPQPIVTTSASIEANPLLSAAPSNEDLWKIREMYLSNDDEDKDIAYKWLCKLIGLKDANANFFILTFYKDWEDDGGFKIDDANSWDLNFKTYPTYFGKDYRYKVRMIAKFGGVEIMNEEMDYGRWGVGNGQPKYDMCQWLCDAFRKSGYSFHSGLFARGSR